MFNKCTPSTYGVCISLFTNTESEIHNMNDESFLILSQASLDIAQDAVNMAKKASLYKEEATKYIQNTKREINEELNKAKREHDKAEQLKQELQNRLNQTERFSITKEETEKIITDLHEVLEIIAYKAGYYSLTDKVREDIKLLKAKLPEDSKTIFGLNNL